MSPELDKKLCEKWPKIFRDRNASPMESCFAFGLECSDGWYDLIDATCEALTYTYTTGITLDEEDAAKYGGEFFSISAPQVVCSQAKEKYSTFRLYYYLEYDPKVQELLSGGKYPDLRAIMDRYSNYIDGIVHMAEILSGRTCELTGRRGEMHATPGRWLKTLNVEFAKTDPWCVSRGYVPVSSLKEDEA